MRDAPPDMQRRAVGLAEDDITARVVLLGRTGLDARLRLDASLELIRVRSGFDAIGELANPVLPLPERTVVILGDDAQIDDDKGGIEAFVDAVRRVAPGAVIAGCFDPHLNPHPVRAYDIVVGRQVSTEQLRALVHGDEPTPPVRDRDARVREPAATPSQREGDEPVRPLTGSTGFVSPQDDEDSEADRGLLLDAEPAPTKPAPTQAAPTELAQTEPVPLEPAASEVEPKRVHSSEASPGKNGAAKPVSPARAPVELDEHELAALSMPASKSGPIDGAAVEMKPARLSSAGDADGVLVTALLGGRDLIEPALGLIRARTGNTAIEFVRSSGTDDAAPAEVSSGAEVSFGSSRYGWLVVGESRGSVSAAPKSLAEHARWLASWLALGEAHKTLRYEAMTDPVSGAWNRRYFDRFLETAIPHARSRRHKLTVLVFDLDNFKSFNDRFGHEAGDVILSETVALMRSMTRPTDRICRIGGDEFAVIFYEPEGPRDKHSDHPEDFEAVAARFQRAVVEQRFPKLGIESPGQLTISGGLATFPWDGQTASELLRRADLLALESKRSGKNQITFGGQRGSSESI